MVHRDGVEKGYFISSDAPGLFMKPGFFRWWNSAPVVALDLTNPEAVAWFVHRLRSLQAATGIDGFKFDAGEPWLKPAGKISFCTMRRQRHGLMGRLLVSACE